MSQPQIKIITYEYAVKILENKYRYFTHKSDRIRHIILSEAINKYGSRNVLLMLIKLKWGWRDATITMVKTIDRDIAWVHSNKDCETIEIKRDGLLLI